MKHIKIIGKTKQEIELHDDDTDNIEIYTKKLSGIFESKSVLIMHSSSGSVIIRPSDIFAVQVINVEVPEDPKKPDEEHLEQKEQQEDILTD
jgi:hypothetical protein